MDVFHSSTVAALCYARKTDLDFQDLATDLSGALRDPQDVVVRRDAPEPGIAFFDLPGMRVGLARVRMAREFPDSLAGRYYPDCILLSVGPGDTPSDTAPRPSRYDRVRQGLVSRIQDVAAADRILLFEQPGVFDLAAHDEIVDSVCAHLEGGLAPHSGPVGAAPDPAAAAEPVTGVNAATPDDMLQNLARRVDSELNRIELARQAREDLHLYIAPPRRRQGLTLVIPRFWPGSGPATARLFMSTAPHRHDRAAYPDYDHMPANVDERPLLHRLAVNALNASVMTFALPVGAALMTMAVFGREDMLVSSRATAITGTAMGLYHSGLADQVLALFS